jgi:O-glycosyl hydrolase
VVLLAPLRAVSPSQLHVDAPSEAAVIEVDPDTRHQVIQGFGLNYTGPWFREDQIRMFDMLIDDLGVSMFRVVAYLVRSDWEEVNDNDDPQSANQDYFDARYSSPIFEASWKGMRWLNSRGIRPVLALMGPAPDWMLERESPPPKHKVCSPESRIGRIKPSMYDEFAETVVTMAAWARRNGHIEFDYFSPVNETDCYPNEGPRVDPDQMPALLHAIAKRMEKEGLGNVMLVVPEQAVIGNNYIGPILSDAVLMKDMGAFALHSYSEDSVGPHVGAVRKAGDAHTPIWLTEYGDLSDLDRTAANEWKSFCLRSNRRALIALNQGASALFYFNAFDDYEECMKRQTYYGLFMSAGHVYTPKKRYWAARQLFRFVKPGAQRVATSTKGSGLTVSAFHDSSAKAIIVVGVKEGGTKRVRISIPSLRDITSQWELYVTTRELNCHLMERVTLNRGIADFELPEEAVFTLVARDSLF